MDYNTLNEMTKKFLLNEGETSVREYIQSLSEILNSLRLTTQRDINRVKIANTHIKEIKKRYKRLEEKITLLEEKVSVLEEVSTMAGGSAGGSVEGYAAPISKQKKKKKD